jgi:Ca2+-binding RTX toxin-like protein
MRHPDGGSQRIGELVAGAGASGGAAKTAAALVAAGTLVVGGASVYKQSEDDGDRGRHDARLGNAEPLRSGAQKQRRSGGSRGNSKRVVPTGNRVQSQNGPGRDPNSASDRSGKDGGKRHGDPGNGNRNDSTESGDRPPAAGGAQQSAQPGTAGSYGDGSISYVAAPGEANTITASRYEGSYLVQDNGAKSMSAGPGCTATTAQEIRCSVPEVKHAAIDSGDGNDFVTAVANADTTRISGGPGNDELNGNKGFGSQSGDDTLLGGDGLDIMRGNHGNDTLDGGSNSDSLFGDQGNDTADYSGRSAPVIVDLAVSAHNGEQGEEDWLSGIENVLGGAGADRLNGSAAANLMVGGAGNDEIRARDGAYDRIECGSGSDSVSADAVDSVASDCEHVDR